MITATGHSCPTAPTALTSRNSGITSTVLGITIVTSVISSTARRARNRSRAIA